ncbi:MAG TPA: cytochrome c peroxidase [Pyrinomonadaceae bacterium]|nr:cytochrome c peroxidase [Pyrinomonadaceae bacterium]
MNVQRCKLIVLAVALLFGGAMFLTPRISEAGASALDEQLAAVLNQHGFTGRAGSSLEQRLGRKLDRQLAELGGSAFHDSLLGLADDNSCAGCHAAPAGFGDTQSIAIGVENNDTVGPDRAGPRNQRRAPSVINNAFFPALMWNSRFSRPSFTTALSLISKTPCVITSTRRAPRRFTTRRRRA